MKIFGRGKAGKKSRHATAGTVSADPRIRSIENFVVEEIELADTAPLTGPQSSRKPKAPPRWWAGFRLASAWAGLWVILVLAGLFARSAWPLDETRQLAIAWEMWQRGDLLAPTLNAAAYTSQPPLLFWLIHLGWAAFGVNDWWPRLVPGIVMLASLLLAAQLVRFLWPGRDAVRRYVPIVLLGGFFWAYCATLLSPDMLAVFFTLLAVYALLWIWRRRDLRAWLLLGTALGLGLLAVGALIFVYVLPVALLAPLWAREPPRIRWGYWYGDLFKAIVVALAIFLAWAGPLMLRAGAGYGMGVLTAPLASHALEIFPAARPWWWYLFLLPLLALPWSLWPLVWMRLWFIRRADLNAGILFCMVWAVPVIAILSLFDIKQPQFLLPVAPAFFLVVTYLLMDDELLQHRHERLASTMIFPIILVGGVLAILPGLPRVELLPDLLWQLSPFVGIAIVAVGVALGWLPIPEIRTRIMNMAAASIVLAALALLAVGWQFNDINRLDDLARYVGGAQRQGRTIAHIGAYDGQLHFAGRLAQPFEIITGEQADDWFAAHPQGLIITYGDGWQPRRGPGEAPAYEQGFRGQGVRVWRAPATGARGG